MPAARSFRTAKTPLSTFFSEPFWPADAAHVQLCNAAPGETVQLHSDISVSFRLSYHAEGALLFALQCWGKRICVVSDYEHGQDDLSDWVHRCDLMIYDGTYTPEEYEAHRGWGHSTWEEGCRLAEEGHVERLLITHHGFSSQDALLRQQEKRAKACFSKVSFAREGTYLEL